MNKCHSNLNWLNDTTPAINDTNLNYMDGCIDTIDSRVVTMDSTKLEAGNIATVIKNVSVNDSTGVFTFTRYDDSTFTVDTMLEKVVTNFGFDETTQKLTITLEDGTTKQVDLSSFIKETEVADTDTVALSLVNHKLTATVKGNSIGDAQMQTQYLADCQSAKNTASSAATSSNTTRLQSEGYALGTQDSVPVGSDSIYYHNNAKWYKDQAQAIASSTLGGLSDVEISNPSDGQLLTYNATSQKWVNADSRSAGTPILIEGCMGDNIVVTDSEGTTVATAIFNADDYVCSVVLPIPEDGETYTFTSTVAKNINNIDENYSKSVFLTRQNTGVLVSPLPRDYLQWSYVQNEDSTNNYFDLGYALADIRGYDINVAFPNFNQNNNYFGGWNGSSMNESIGLHSNEILIGLGLDSNTMGIPYNTNRHRIRLSLPNGYIDGELKSSSASWTWTTSGNALLFNRITYSSYRDGFGCRLAKAYVSKFYLDNNVMCRHIVPATRKVDGKVGFYDMVSGSFILPTVGNFTVGND